MQNNDGSMSLNVIIEKCDWDLYDFLNKIPRDMPEAQCRSFAKQVGFRNLLMCLRFYLDIEWR